MAQLYADGDKITETYEMPIIVDAVNHDAVSEVIAYHLNCMALELKALDKQVHTMQ